MFSKNTTRGSVSPQETAFNEFKKVAQAEQANGAETLSLFGLVPKFSTAPKIITDETMVLMRYWSRNGHGQWLTESAQELKNWAQNNGYHNG